MPLNVRNLDYLKSKDVRLYEALSDIIGGVDTHGQQANLNATGQPIPPPQVNGVRATAQNGHMTVAITDNNQIYSGIQYFVEHADNPQFTNPQIVHLGDRRNSDPIYVGNQTRYVRAYSSYPFSAPSQAVYHGLKTQPTAVAGGGSDSGPAFLPSQGSGTGGAGQGLQGPGQFPFRSANGKPPIR